MVNFRKKRYDTSKFTCKQRTKLINISPFQQQGHGGLSKQAALDLGLKPAHICIVIRQIVGATRQGDAPHLVLRILRLGLLSLIGPPQIH